MFKSIIGVIFSPKDTLRQTSESSKVFPNLVFILIIQLCIGALEIPNYINYSTLKFSEMENISENFITGFNNTLTTQFFIGILLKPIVMILVITLLIKLISLFFIIECSFKKLFCLNTLSYIPVIVGDIIKAVLIKFVPTGNIPNVTTSMTLFLDIPSNNPDLIYKLFSFVDIFFIWSLLLIAISTSIAFNINTKKSIFMIFSIYIVAILVLAVILPPSFYLLGTQ